jgi:ribosomal protein S3
MRLFAHRRFLRLLATFLRPYVSLHPEAGKILGFNLVVTGKISVTGNAMSRTMQVRHGKGGTNNLRYHAISAFALIRTKTGCLGLSLGFFF